MTVTESLSKQLDKYTRIPLPFVYYQCPCQQTQSHNSSSQGGELSDEERRERTQPPVLSDFLSLFPISRLYYCGECKDVVCPLCVEEEIVCYYCPNCLFEVPTASVKSEKNRCGRNCFECPVCQATLSVISTVEPTPKDAEDVEPAERPQANSHYLGCSSCHWDSREVGLEFERPTGIATQMQPLEDMRADIKEFENLRQYYEKFVKSKDTTSSSMASLRGSGSLQLPPTLLASMPGLASLNLGSRSSITHLSRGDVRLEAYVPSHERTTEEDQHRVNLMRTGIEQPTTLNQRLSQPNSNPIGSSNLLPQRIQLRTKRTKKCGACSTILVKPQQRAQNIRFTVLSMAFQYIPTITIPKKLPDTLTWNTTFELALQFENPMHHAVQVNLAANNSEQEGQCTVTLVAPTFTIDGAREIWEYEGGDPAAETGDRDIGILERQENTTTVIVRVNPRQSGDSGDKNEVQFAMYVQVGPSKEASQAAAEETSTGPSQTLTEGETPAQVPAPLLQTLGFWVIIGVGRVAASVD
ncbi:dynactin p62 family-domain-containing protein [Phlyctochytrium arcticum]|nr:dynactin p62 family-domain-containing protein [Phlyctochytrium arcticum]